jgi:hypothetical protein
MRANDGLAGKVVHSNFWPACANCSGFTACARAPKHPAYPHTWHWGVERVRFAEGDLIVRSWVGSSVIGQRHTGCPHYSVAPQHVQAPRSPHRQYLALEREKAKIEAVLALLERQEEWSTHDEAVFARVFQRYKNILEEQRTLRSALSAPAQPTTAAVNE